MNTLLAFALFLFSSSAVLASDDFPLLPGSWEITTKIDPKTLEESMKDLPEEARQMLKESMGNGEVTAQECVTEEDMNRGFFIPEEEGCTNKQISKSDLKWTYEMECKDPVSKSRIEFEFGKDKKTYKSKIHTETTEEGQTTKVDVEQTAKWTGAACN